MLRFPILQNPLHADIGVQSVGTRDRFKIRDTRKSKILMGSSLHQGRFQNVLVLTTRVTYSFWDTLYWYSFNYAGFYITLTVFKLILEGAGDLVSRL